jgi:DNA repair protein RadA/Sms
MSVETRIESEIIERFSAGCPGFDRVLGGGFVRGSVTLLRGMPGAGKTTLTAAVAQTARRGPPARRALFVSGEQSVDYFLTMPDLSGMKPSVELLCDTDGAAVRQIVSRAEKIRAALVVVDGLQTAYATVSQRAGQPSEQLKVVDLLRTFAHAAGAVVIITSHTNRQGGTAGGERVTHIVDAVLDLEPHPDPRCAQCGLRVLRATKSRYGPHAVASLFLLNGRVCIDTGAAPC